MHALILSVALCPAAPPAQAAPQKVTLTQARQRLESLNYQRTCWMSRPFFNRDVLGRLDILIAKQNLLIALLEAQLLRPDPVFPVPQPFPVPVPQPRGPRLDFRFEGGGGGEFFAPEQPFPLPAGTPPGTAPASPPTPAAPRTMPPASPMGGTPPGTAPLANGGDDTPGGLMRLTRDRQRWIYRYFRTTDGRVVGRWVADYPSGSRSK